MESLDFYDNKKFDKDEFFDIFSDSVDVRTKSDVPYATFLSGGLDSSSIVKSQHEKGNEINTFSVYMGSSTYDESKYCEQVSKKFNTNHKSIEIEDSLRIENLQGMLDCLDQPFYIRQSFLLKLSQERFQNILKWLFQVMEEMSY